MMNIIYYESDSVKDGCSHGNIIHWFFKSCFEFSKLMFLLLSSV